MHTGCKKIIEVLTAADEAGEGGGFALEIMMLKGGAGLDRQSEASRTCFLCNPRCWEVIRDAGLRAEYLILRAWGEHLHATQRSGMTQEWRLERLERYSALFHLVMPIEVFENGRTPLHTLGVASGIWVGAQQIRDSSSWSRAHQGCIVQRGRLRARQTRYSRHHF